MQIDQIRKTVVRRPFGGLHQDICSNSSHNAASIKPIDLRRMFPSWIALIANVSILALGRRLGRPQVISTLIVDYSKKR